LDRRQAAKPGLRVRSAHVPELGDVRGLATGHDILQSLIPSVQHADLALDKVSVDVVTYQRSGFPAARLMPDYCGDKIERNGRAW
jgi:hypothetical protein